MDIIKIGLLGVVGVGIALFVRQSRPEYAYLFILAMGLFIFYLCIDTLLLLLDTIRQIGGAVENMDAYIRVLVKILGISYISEFCGDVCKDAGYQSVGRQVEIAGKFCVMLTGMPIFLALIDAIGEYF